MTWHAALDYHQRHGLAHVLATQVTAQGSTPREPGARMVVTLNRVFDTLGGGTFEWQTIDAARRYLTENRTGFHLEAFSLGGRSGQCCGGFVNVLLEVFAEAPTTLAVFGAGHVGRHVIALSAPFGWQRYWFDSRPDAFRTAPDDARLTCSPLEDIRLRVASLSPGSHVLVVTHSHDEDYALIEALIERNDLGSIGLIGSDSKWASFQARLRRAGCSSAQIARIRCPIGVINGAKSSNKAPYAIALSVVAELAALSDTPQQTSTRGLDGAPLRALFDTARTS
ncbi:xanthine dehydrogenase accessory protein XdhC [Halomonas sp. HNIBRBA4712]|uniref:xanthine dehydrogenase accessory protein XdhC n=1 Tax=Halomonas sp. HNIBRBA4712 TaxID=3373087 RepID=UPI003747055E